MNYQLDKKLGQQLIGMLLKQIGTSPLFIWGGLLTLLLSVASIATQELTSPGPIEPVEIAASPVQSSEAATTLAQKGAGGETPTPVQSSTAAVEIYPQADETLPLWLFGAIAIGCAGGSWLISQQINRKPMLADPIGATGRRLSLGQVRQPRRPTRPQTSLAQREARESGRVMSRMGRSRAASVARVPQQTSRSRTTPEVSRATIRGRSDMTGQLQQAHRSGKIRTRGPQKQEVQMQRTLPKKQSQNVVVPGMEIYKGDRALSGKEKRGEKSLAEMMDIRKRGSIASVVRNL
ncbi:MAG: hypothetical protein AB4352_20705 [Hormoscilla sp.]